MSVKIQAITLKYFFYSAPTFSIISQNFGFIAEKKKLDLWNVSTTKNLIWGGFTGENEVENVCRKNNRFLKKLTDYNMIIIIIIII